MNIECRVYWNLLFTFDIEYWMSIKPKHKNPKFNGNVIDIITCQPSTYYIIIIKIVTSWHSIYFLYFIRSCHEKKSHTALNINKILLETDRRINIIKASRFAPKLSIVPYQILPSAKSIVFLSPEEEDREGDD